MREGLIALTCRAVSPAIAAGSLLIAVAASPPAPSLPDALRRDDAAAVRVALKGGASPNARDDIGATPVMFAAAFSSADVLRTLIDAGGDVNVATDAGATPLMWAAGDAGKVRLLLDRGAAVGPRTKGGESALLVAARHGNRAAVELLLARGADSKDAARTRAELIAVSERPSSNITVANLPLSNTEAVRRLLERGADPNPRSRYPILGIAAFQGQRRTAEVLLEYGTDPNAKGQQDVTPLMMAAAARPDPDVIRLLLEYGADINGRDQAGRTPLDWALTQGETAAARALRAAGGGAGTPSTPPPTPAAKERTSRDAVAAAVAKLEPAGAVLYDRRKCISCHQQTLPIMAIQRASERGIAVDRDVQAQLIRSVVDTWSRRREELMLGREVAGGANDLAYGLTAFAEANVPANPATDAAVVDLLSLQHNDGSWVFLDTRPPQADNSPIAFTAMAIRGLTTYVPPGLMRDAKASVARALSYLRAAQSTSTQDEAFRLTGLAWARAPRPEVASQAARLIALQRENGGWAQLATMQTDAYATGEALYALAVSGMSSSAPVYRRGVENLLRTQLEDGTWFVRSRAFGFQPYFETGFPHGRDQFISTSATAWAALALGYGL